MTTKHDYQAAQRWIDTEPNAPKHYTEAGNEKNREAIRHALATMQRMRWQPIETAPRDGTDILCVVAGSNAQTGKPYVPMVACFCEGRWTTEDLLRLDEYEDRGPYEPTHWMPLPAAPNVTGGDE